MLRGHVLCDPFRGDPASAASDLRLPEAGPDQRKPGGILRSSAEGGLGTTILAG